LSANSFPFVESIAPIAELAAHNFRKKLRSRAATIHRLRAWGLNMFDNEHRGVDARHPNMTKGSSQPG